MTSAGISRLRLLIYVLAVTLLQNLVNGQVNIALNKTTDQSTDLNFNGFDWTSDKAVDGCDLRDDSENQACCSCTQEDPFGNNFWSVDLGQQYLIQTIIVLGRSDTPTQLENFQLFRQEIDFGPELLVYDNLGVEYNDGNFTINIDPPVPAQFIVIRKPGILTLCEVLVFAELLETSTASASTTEQEATSITEETTEVSTVTGFSTESPTTTTESGCPPFSYGEFCIACGNCFNNAVCDPVDGSCPSGCAPGYFGTSCTLGCPGGLYGPDCVNVCGNCFLDAVCNAETGTCPLGCDSGWTTSQCDQSCPGGNYGTNCESVCGNCLDAEACNNVNGVCPSGCAPGWEGVLCDTLSPTTTTTVSTSTGTEESVQETNVAQGKPANQFSTLDYLFLWTADKAVDGCLLRDDPDNQQCCSATEGRFENFWTVDLQQQYIVSRILVTGRTADFSSQLEGFIVYTKQDEFSPEIQVYNNAFEGYGDGTFTISLEPLSLVQFVTIRRPSGTIIVICEVEVFGVLPTTTTTTPSTTTTTTITQPSTTTTMSTVPRTTSSTLVTTTSSAITITMSTESSETSSPIATSSEGSPAPPITVNTNIAFNKPASQFSTLDYFFLWTADKAVDGCLLRNDPDNQQCCSATEGGADNFWTVDLQQQYLVYQIVITGRTPESSNQLEGFAVYTKQEDFFPELSVYNNDGQPYGNGTFIIDIPVPSLVQFVTIRRPSGFILVLCEVEVYAIPNEPITTTTTIQTTTSTEIPTTTTEPCPINTYGDECTLCGNCFASIACNTVTGECPIGCAAGWQPPLCNTQCTAGFYGVDCLETCGNCQFDAPCDVVTGACLGGCDPGWEGINCDSEETNVALGKPANQFSTLDFLFLWTADKAVDGCLLRDDPDNQQCCSATEGGFENFWTVDLQQRHLVSTIVVIGRTSDFSSQLEDFIVFTQQDEFSPEIQVYNNAFEGYGDGTFTIRLEPPSLLQLVTIRRPSGTIIVICEVEVFGVIDEATTTSAVTSTTTTATTTTTITTTTNPASSTVLPTVTSTEDSSTATEITDETNIALNKPASQFSTLDYLFLWTPDKAVDGCLLRDDPDNQQCCSATEGGADNFWTVDLQQQFLVYRIIVTGRTSDFSNQLENFEVYTRQESFFPELLVYSNNGQAYGDGTFVIDIPEPSLVQFVTVKRPTGTIIVLCEVEVFAIIGSQTTSLAPTTQTVTSPEPTTQTVTSLAPTTQTVTSLAPTTETISTTTTSVTTTEEICPINTYGDECMPCGNCLTIVPCDVQTGECNSGCQAGWQPPMCDTACTVGTFGFDCSETCGNCQFGAPCDVTTGACPGGCDPGWEGINCDSAITTSTSTESTTTTEIQSTTEVIETNVAFGKPAIQFSTLDYIFLWTADKAVDGCLLRDDPDNQQCCSATEGDIFQNFWSVDLQQQYLVSRITVTGRTPESSGQLQGFTLYVSETAFASESFLYNNGLEIYDDGIFEINIEPPRIVQIVTIRRPTDAIIVICEVEVFGVPYIPTTSSTTGVTTTTVTTGVPTSTATTVVPTTECPTNTWGDACTSCGNCVTFIPCDTTTGVCAVGCLEGWQPPLCDTPCSAGFYGVDCFQTCGNCQFGTPCDVVTGACPGGCDPGWEGINCDLAITTTTSTEATTTEVRTTTGVPEINIALGKPATQFSTLDYIFLWTADKAVDGCLLRDDPDNQQCCSATEGDIFQNFWSVDLQQQYLVSRITVTGRTSENSGQLEGFTLYTSETEFSPEVLLYNNGLEVYDDGIFEINIEPSRIVKTVTIRRPTDTLIVLCEVEVFGVPYVPPTSSTTDVTTTTSTTGFTSTDLTTVSTTPELCPPNTYGDDCTPCGNCLTFNPCNSVTGVCPIACAAGWQPPLCNTACQTGFYGIDCLQTCGNCQFGVPCDVVSGACPGPCNPGWEGINCDIAVTTASTTELTTTQEPSTTSTEVIGENIAFGKPATQFFTLDFLFFWTADKAVDGCLLRDDPDNQQCCSATEGGFENFWTVDLQEQYLVSRIVVIGRLEANSAQLEGFQLYTSETQFSPEILLYNNVGDLYNDGIFNIDINPPRVVQSVTIRRPTGTIIVLCEVEVFGVLIEETTTLSSTTITENTTSSLTPISESSTLSSSPSSSVSTTQTSTEVTTQETTSGPTATTSQAAISVVSTAESTQRTSTGTMSSLESTSESVVSTQESTSGLTTMSNEESTESSSSGTEKQTTQSTDHRTSPEQTEKSSSGSSTPPSLGSTPGSTQDDVEGPSTGSTQTGVSVTTTMSTGSTVMPSQDDAEGPSTGSTQSGESVTTISTEADMTTSLNFTQYDGSTFTKPMLAVLVTSFLLAIVCSWTM